MSRVARCRILWSMTSPIEPKPIVPARVVNAFLDCFTARETLRTIDVFFDDLEFDRDGGAEQNFLEQGHGQRRSRAGAYLATLHLDDPRDADGLLRAISLKLVEWEHRIVNGYRDDLDRLVRNLELSGFAWDGARATRRSLPLEAGTFAANLETLASEDVDREVERIFAAIENDPADAITASRALLETVCKLVLEELGESFSEADDLPSLYKKTSVALKLDPTQHEAVYRQTLQGLVSAVQGLAEVRNRLGDAHGKGRAAARAQPRHARMAAGAAMTVASFLVDTMGERRRAV